MRMKVPSFVLHDRISIALHTGEGAYGDTWGAPVAGIKAHVEATNRLVIDRDGQTVRAEASVILRPEVGVVPVESKVTWGGKTFRVLSAGALPDEVRPTHRELMIG